MVELTPDAGIAASLRTTDCTFLVSTGSPAQVMAASTFAGAVLALVIAPPLIAQLANRASSWIPNTLSNVLPTSVTTW